MINEVHPEDQQYEGDRRAEIKDEIERLELSHRVAESHRRNCLSILEQASEGRDYWDKESARLLGEIERLKDML